MPGNGRFPRFRLMANCGLRVNRLPLLSRELTVDLEILEHVTNAAIDIPGIGTRKILPINPDTRAYKHPPFPHYIPSEFKFEGHGAFRAPFPIDLPFGLYDAPPMRSPECIDL